MTLQDLTDPKAVLRAIEEFDSMGREAFLKKHGFGRGTKYLIDHNGRYYDSKAIAGVAHLHQTGTLLRNSAFRGGANAAAGHLQAMGFTVASGKPPAAVSHSFELIWNPKRSPGDAGVLRALQASITAGLTPLRSWHTGPTKSGIQAGDRLFLFLVGSAKRGLIGSGHATGQIYAAPHYDPALNYDIPYVPIAWDAVVDPDNALPWNDIQKIAPGFPDMFRSNGQLLEPSLTRAVDALWQDHVDTVSLRPVASPPAPGVKESYSSVMVKRRNHQRRFKNLLFQYYAPVCHVCGFDLVQILEAAHLIPDAKGGRSDVKNGRLMCPNHHRAHDANLFHLDNIGRPVWRDNEHEFLAPLRP